MRFAIFLIGIALLVAAVTAADTQKQTKTHDEGWAGIKDALDISMKIAAQNELYDADKIPIENEFFDGPTKIRTKRI